MSTTTLDRLIGRHRRHRFIARRFVSLIHQDRLPADVARRVVHRAITEGDPWILAECGQTWVLRDERHGGSESGAAPGQVLKIMKRTGGGQLSVINPAGASTEISLYALDLYELSEWEWRE
ncbi:hypothetical protein [Streptomyces sp. NPDC051909]|uniref:hypothetical protein n=1 Tax=Streptomyces sp. NPDC051909 TaxID=3154944 RepID=UPI00342E6837